MPEIFLSYARSDESEHGKVRPIAEALQAAGYDVFWDANIPAGRDFIEYLEQQLDAAKCVVVVWSKKSRKSFWVREEAASGRDRRILVPITLDDSALPLGFRSIQTISLQNWDGSLDEKDFERLIRSIDQHVPRRRTTGASRVTSATPWHLTLLLDDSTSVMGETARMINKALGYMIDEMHLLSRGSNPYFYLSMISFGSACSVLMERTSVNSIKSDQEYVSGSGGTSNVGAALRVARNLLQSNPGKETDFTPYVFVLMSGDPDDPNMAIQAASALKDLQLPSGPPQIVALSIGKDSDETFMKMIVSRESFHIILDEPQKIVRFFPAIGTIAGQAANGEKLDHALINL